MNQPSLDRRDVLRLAVTFGLTLTLPGFAGPASAAPLTVDEMKLVADVSDLIIPATDTGGAVAAGVPDFVQMMLAGWFTAAEREHFLSGLREFSSGARQQYGKKFADMTSSQKDEYLGARLEAAEGAPAAGGSVTHAPFVVLMKRLTIFGYYTSELGATIELHQRIAAAQYLPDAVLAPGERADSGITSATYTL